jgi:hypothetical protein
MSANLALPIPHKQVRQTSRAEIGDRVFVVGGKRSSGAVSARKPGRAAVWWPPVNW